MFTKFNSFRKQIINDKRQNLHKKYTIFKKGTKKNFITRWNDLKNILLQLRCMYVARLLTI
jgi:hypothetical protein